MTIEKLAQRKTELNRTLQAIAMCNTPEKLEDAIKLNLQQIEAEKELYEVDGKIRDYIEGREVKDMAYRQAYPEEFPINH